MPEGEVPETWESDLRRGILQLLVLAIIRDAGTTFGYAIAQTIRERTADRLILQDGTLYPLLRRLEQQKLVQSTWDVSGERPRKYYRLTTAGDQQLRTMLTAWMDFVAALDPIFRTSAAATSGKHLAKERAQFCARCGVQVYPGAVFCAACGSKLTEDGTP
jgi:DNA-binding PadR family transcriptional regulator